LEKVTNVDLLKHDELSQFLHNKVSQVDPSFDKYYKERII